MLEPLPQQEPPQPLHTAHLELRAFTRDELEAVADAAALSHFAREFPPAETTDWARGAIEAGEHFFTESEHTRLAVVERTTGEVVGTAGFTGPAMDGELEVEGSLVPGVRRRGLAAEALDALVARAFVDQDVRAVCASVPEDMEHVHRLLTGHGFVRRPSAGSETSYQRPRA